MKGKVLITDTLFMSNEHVKQIEAAGYDVERIEKADASEDELIAGLQGKVGYVLGGIEKVTDKVIEAAKDLRVIAFTGADWQALITGWEKAKEKGIKISNAPGANSPAVAEFALTMTLAMQRNLFELGRTGDVGFETASTLQNATVGVIGSGHIGSKIIKMLNNFAPAKVLYHARNKNGEVESSGAEYTDLETLLTSSDVVIIAVPGSAGEIMDKTAISSLKDNALIVSISPRNHFDFDALLVRLQDGSLRAAIDWPAPSEEYKMLPLHTFFYTNNHTAYNTKEVIQICSDMGTNSLLNLLEKGEDKYQVL
jgi:phosphoglycerate dehydrogenase-like enzyme